MEEMILNQFKHILDSESVTGCVMADAQGLCLLASPNVKPESAGLISALAQHATSIDAKNTTAIDAGNTNPIICLEGNTRQCLIKNEEGITVAIFKNKITQSSQS